MDDVMEVLRFLKKESAFKKNGKEEAAKTVSLMLLEFILYEKLDLN